MWDGFGKNIALRCWRIIGAGNSGNSQNRCQLGNAAITQWLLHPNPEARPPIGCRSGRSIERHEDYLEWAYQGSVHPLPKSSPYQGEGGSEDGNEVNKLLNVKPGWHLVFCTKNGWSVHPGSGQLIGAVLKY